MKRYIKSAETNEDTRIKDASDILKDDFNYVIDGLYTLNRKGLTSEGVDIAEQLSISLQDCIQQIGKLLG